MSQSALHPIVKPTAADVAAALAAWTRKQHEVQLMQNTVNTCPVLSEHWPRYCDRLAVLRKEESDAQHKHTVLAAKLRWRLLLAPAGRIRYSPMVQKHNLKPTEGGARP